MQSQHSEIEHHIRAKQAFDNPFGLEEAGERYHAFGLTPLLYDPRQPEDLEPAPPEPYLDFFWDYNTETLWVLRQAYEDGVEGTATMWPFGQLEDMEQKEVRDFLWHHEVEV